MARTVDRTRLPGLSVLPASAVFSSRRPEVALVCCTGASQYRVCDEVGIQWPSRDMVVGILNSYVPSLSTDMCSSGIDLERSAHSTIFEVVGMVLPCAASCLTFNRMEDAPVFIIAFEACSKRNTSGSDSSAFVSRTWTDCLSGEVALDCACDSRYLGDMCPSVTTSLSNVACGLCISFGLDSNRNDTDSRKLSLLRYSERPFKENRHVVPFEPP